MPVSHNIFEGHSSKASFSFQSSASTDELPYGMSIYCKSTSGQRRAALEEKMQICDTGAHARTSGRKRLVPQHVRSFKKSVAFNRFVVFSYKLTGGPNLLS